ncbi:MAG: hypothetical protein KGI70_00830 [Patescibacteria group bacterium]|nr:hypothetical protein [Patescibacteria group bacterium]
MERILRLSPRVQPHLPEWLWNIGQAIGLVAVLCLIAIGMPFVDARRVMVQDPISILHDTHITPALLTWYAVFSIFAIGMGTAILLWAPTPWSWNMIIGFCAFVGALIAATAWRLLYY